ncbi:MAG: hypothetical protein O2840_04605 [bacterium]|nr:hypothetical protein [bacterium]
MHEIKSDIQKALEVGERVIGLEKSRAAEGNKPWAVYGSGLNEFARTFRGLPHGDIKEIMGDRPNAHILEVMGDGQVCRELDDVSGGVALTAADSRGESQKSFDEKYGLGLVSGNIISSMTWSKARKYMREHGIPGFDLAVARPVGGLDLENSLNSPKILQLLMQRMWTLLRPNGILLFQYSLKNSFDPRKYIVTLRKHGFTVFDNGRALQITKDSRSGERLPYYEDEEALAVAIPDETTRERTVANEIGVDASQSTYGEKVVFSGLVKPTFDGFGKDFFVTIDGAVSHNLSSYGFSKLPEIKITAKSGEDVIGDLVLYFEQSTPQIRNALGLPDSAPETVLINGFVQSVKKSRGLGTWLMDFGERNIQSIITALANYGIVPPETRIVRVYVDVASDDDKNWTARYLKKRQGENSENPLTTVTDKIFTRDFRAKSTISHKQTERLQMEAEEKTRSLKRRIVTTRGLASERDLEMIPLPNFHPDTGERIAGLLSEQLAVVLAES